MNVCRCLVIAGLLPFLLSAPALAENRKPTKGNALNGDRGPQVDESSEVANLMRRAADAIDRADWKLAIDSAQRVIQNPQGLRPSADNRDIYVSPRRAAQELLAGMPAAGVRAYRILYNGRAKGLLDRARAEADMGLLREICDLYLLTRWGAEAANDLAARLLDLGRESEALMLLDELQAVYPDDHGLQTQIDLKRALAANLLGYERRCEELLVAIRSRVEPNDEILAAVRSFISADRGAHLSGLEKELVDWTGPGGGGECRGLMQAVVPAFDNNLPWRRTVPSLAPGVWPNLDAMDPAHMLVSTPVVADERLFVRSGRETLALDLRSFALLWSSGEPAEGVAERHWFRNGPRAPKSRSFARSEQRLLTDYVGGTLTVSHGLVFAVERGRGLAFDDDGISVVRRNVVRGRPREQSAGEGLSSRIAAYDAATGRLRWQVGVGTDSDERLIGAQILAPPVGVGDNLWAPYEQSGDLYIAVLDPSDGQMIRRLFLCALGGRSVSGTAGIFLAVADGTVYVPTGHGLLFAIKADDYTVRWALRYKDHPDNRSRGRNSRRIVRRAVEWLSGPPMVVGSLLILGPTDDDRLLAVDRLSGELVWSLPREPHRYVIAADQDHVWVGGHGISRVSISNAAYEWTTPAFMTTGRAVLSGGTIYAPTRSELLAISADSGETTDRYTLPQDQPPLGNLLCIGDSLISLDPSEVRAFPDRGSYESTLARFREDPTDARIAVRLSFMELMEQRPRKALAVLSEVRIADSFDADAQGRHVAHLRVEALMQLGDTPGLPNAEAIEHLQRAVSSAVEPQDQLAARLALGQKLRRTGRFKQAYETLLSLGLSSLGDGYENSGPVRRQARIVLESILKRIEPELGPGEVGAIADRIRGDLEQARLTLGAPSEGEHPRGLKFADRFDPTTRSGAVKLLRALAGCGVLGGLDSAALNELGRFELRRGRYERSEQYFTESVRRFDSGEGRIRGTHGLQSVGFEESRGRIAEALLGLMDLYLTPELALVASARDAADRLMRDFADVKVRGPWVGGTAGLLKGGSVGSLVAERRREIDVQLAEAHDAGIEPLRFTTTSRKAYSMLDKTAPPSLLAGRQGRPESMVERQLVFVPPRTVRSHRIEDGTLEWKSEMLMLMEDFAFERGLPGTNLNRSHLERRTLMTDGQTAVIASERGLHALGTITGIRLWAIEFEGGDHFGDPGLRESTTDVDAGRLACMLAPNRLAVYWMLEDRPLWERKLRGGAVRAVRIRDEFILTADPNLETVHVYRLDDGAELSVIEFKQPGATDGSKMYSDSEGGWAEIPVTYVDGLVCGPDGSSIVGYSARTGEREWTLSLHDEPSSMVEIGDGRLVIGTEDGYHWIVDAHTGEVLLEKQYDELIGGAIDGVEEDGVLVLAGYREAKDGYRWQLLGVDLESGTGDVVWNRDFLGLATGPNLRSVEGVIPVVELQLVKHRSEDKKKRGRPAAAYSYRQAIVLVDKVSGRTVGDPLSVDLPGQRLTGDIQVWPGRMAVQTNQGILTYETNAAIAVSRGGVD